MQDHRTTNPNEVRSKAGGDKGRPMLADSATERDIEDIKRTVLAKLTLIVGGLLYAAALLTAVKSRLRRGAPALLRGPSKVLS